MPESVLETPVVGYLDVEVAVTVTVCFYSTGLSGRSSLVYSKTLVLSLFSGSFLKAVLPSLRFVI